MQTSSTLKSYFNSNQRILPANTSATEAAPKRFVWPKKAGNFFVAPANEKPVNAMDGTWPSGCEGLLPPASTWSTALIRNSSSILQWGMSSNFVARIAKTMPLLAIQVGGADFLRGADGNLPSGGGAVWLASHAHRLDPYIMLSLLARLPKAPRLTGTEQVLPIVIARASTTWWDWLLEEVLFSSYFAQVTLREQRQGESDEEGIARRASNQSILRQTERLIAVEGRHALLFPEGHRTGTGELKIQAQQATSALLADHPAFVASIAYDNWSGAGRQAFVGIRPLKDRQALNDSAESRGLIAAQIAAATPLTSVAIVGAFLGTVQSLRRSSELHVNAAFLDTLLKDASLVGIRAGLAVDAHLRDARKRVQYVAELEKKLRDFSFIDQFGQLASETDELSRYTNLTMGAEQEDFLEATSSLVDEKPLHFWGRRLKQQTQGNVELRSGLLQVFSRSLDFEEDETDFANPLSDGCQSQ